MSAVPEEVLKETAATGDPPNRLASPEFFFLLQRIDRLDEKLSREIKDVDEKLSREIKSVDLKLSTRIDTLDEKLSKEIKAVDEKLSKAIKEVETKLDAKLDTLRFWTMGTIITLIVGFAGVIITVLQR